MNKIEKRFVERLAPIYQAATPGLCVQAYSRGRKIVDVRLGETYDIYDWASVTKIVFTASSLMFMHDADLFRVNDKVGRWVPWFPVEHPARLRELLSHTAGLTWWYPFYKELDRKVDARATPETAWQAFEQILKRKVLADLKKQGPKKWLNPKPKALYSDLDLFALGVAMEHIAEKPLYEIWSDARERMGLRETDFNRGNRLQHPKKSYAPTEKDVAWRKRTLQGEVHDQNTWALKGVAPHAGLFGPIDELSAWGLLLRKTMLGNKIKNFASPETVALFTKRAIPRARGDWALDFMMPSREGASCGPLFGPRTVGHLGFTGTSLWFDPERDLLVTILSNRIHPTVENIEIRKLRPLIHTWIAEET